ncbi:MAG TPA: acyl-CoA thioesterase [Candidatus Marinimicrobia bacterium]|jgi:acyl-CoA hydrolase|nr:acyl-CoA thioesterase [Candidatus Neomarinimicrobiota bacterium]HIL86752.1 acyl-CoA thioesterase [Candidatus Neomarinimicrobiota bacterium]
MNNPVTKYSELVQHQHINSIQTLFGGYMLSWLDLAAAKASSRFLENTDAWGAVTRAMDSVEFKEPVFLGDWVNCEATVYEAGKSSIKVSVKAYAESKVYGKRLACTANFTFVSIIRDKNNKFIKFDHNISLQKEN